MSAVVIDVAQRLNAKRNGKGYMAKCPAHADRRASLSISEGRDGRVLLHCHAGCIEATESVSSCVPMKYWLRFWNWKQPGIGVVLGEGGFLKDFSLFLKRSPFFSFGKGKDELKKKETYEKSNLTRQKTHSFSGHAANGVVFRPVVNKG
jgi:hypothetical protein